MSLPRAPCVGRLSCAAALRKRTQWPGTSFASKMMEGGVPQGPCFHPPPLVRLRARIPRPLFCMILVAPRVESGPDAAPVCVGVQVAGHDRSRLPHRRQARQRGRAAGPEGGRRRAQSDTAGRGIAARAARRLRRAAVRRRSSPNCATSCSCASRSAPSGASRWKSSAICTRCRCAFHLERQTGGMSRDIERGTKGISTLLSYMLFSILPVILEFGLVAAVLFARFDWRFPP
jgi:hypothetical protein